MNEPEQREWIEFNQTASRLELEFITSTTSALFWHENSIPKPRNGSTSFLNLGDRTFAVTAQHVIEGFRQSRDTAGGSICRVAGKHGALNLADIETRLIAEDGEIDVATFAVTDEEVRELGKTVVNIRSENWPPPQLRQQQGVMFSGYPYVGTFLNPSETVFSAVSQGLSISSVSDIGVDCQIERDKIMGLLGEGIPPENFNFGGISGAAMFARVRSQSGIIFWTFAGVVIQGPNTDLDPNISISGFELIRGRRSHFIKADGTLDRELWAHATFAGR